jgi:hypothetical protein
MEAPIDDPRLIWGSTIVFQQPARHIHARAGVALNVGAPETPHRYRLFQGEMLETPHPEKLY